MTRFDVQRRKLPSSHSDNDGVGGFIVPAIEIKGYSGDAAYGKPVPPYRKSAALNAIRQMDSNLSREAGMQIVDQMSNHIERDQPYEAMNVAYHKIDLTGTYRLLAVLLCAEEPLDKPRVRVKAGSNQAEAAS